MNEKQLRFILQKDPLGRRINMWILAENLDRANPDTHLARFEFNPIEDGDILYDHAAIGLQDDALQQLMDEMWRNGVRPSEGVASAGQIDAVQAHLRDMQALVGHFVYGGGTQDVKGPVERSGGPYD